MKFYEGLSNKEYNDNEDNNNIQINNLKITHSFFRNTKFVDCKC
jgi:hypothetical protein